MVGLPHARRAGRIGARVGASQLQTRPAVERACGTSSVFNEGVAGAGGVRFWAQIQKECGRQEVHIHDLRQTFASLLVSGGASLEMIGWLLGHTKIGTTQRYAHLIDSPLRAGLNAVAEML
jgi:integrase